MFFEIGLLQNFANFTGKHLCWILFSIKHQVVNNRSNRWFKAAEMDKIPSKFLK